MAWVRFVLSAVACVASFPQSVVAQKYLDIKNLNMCSYYGEAPNEELVVFEPDHEALSFVAGITKHTGIPQNFTIKSGNVRNALAIVNPMKAAERYIVYNQEFLGIASNQGDARWFAISVLAHEIGHHLIGHALSRTGLGPRKEQELEADRYSGHVLRKMNATLDQAKLAMQRQPDGREGQYPAKSARLAAIHSGWIAANEEIETSARSAKTPEAQLRPGAAVSPMSGVSPPPPCKEVSKKVREVQDAPIRLVTENHEGRSRYSACKTAKEEAKSELNDECDRKGAQAIIANVTLGECDCEDLSDPRWGYSFYCDVEAKATCRFESEVTKRETVCQ